MLIEYPVVYFSDTDAETAIALRQPTLAEDIARLTGLPVERRATCARRSTNCLPTPGRRTPPGWSPGLIAGTC